MESNADRIGGAAETTGEPVDARVGDKRGESLYGPGVPTAESFADDALGIEWSYDVGGPSAGPIPGRVEPMSEGEDQPE